MLQYSLSIVVAHANNTEFYHAHTFRGKLHPFEHDLAIQQQQNAAQMFHIEV